jgi:type I restriction enzyme S subunit
MKEGWRRIRIGDELAVVTGNTPPKSNELLFGDYMPLVKPPELRDCELADAEDGLSQAGAKLARIAPIGSVLVSCIGNLGKIGLNSVPVAFNQQINAILPSPSRVVPGFLFYQVLSTSFRSQLEASSSGTTIPIVNKSRFQDI